MTLTSVLNRKTVSISDDTHKELVKLGVYGETIDDIIRKCIEAYKRENEKRFGSKTANR
jgi:predicted CopG family antitoxin